MVRSNPQKSQAFCSVCGAETSQECPECSTPIRGYLHRRSVIVGGEYERPKYCHNCGKPYPWTILAIESAIELFVDDVGMQAVKDANLEETVTALTTDTPKTPLAIARFKRFITQATAATIESVQGILVELISEAVKKKIWP